MPWNLFGLVMMTSDWGLCNAILDKLTDSLHGRNILEDADFHDQTN